MYANTQQSRRSTHMVGIVTSVLLTAGAGYVLATGMNIDPGQFIEPRTEMVIIAPPEPPPPVQEIKKVEIEEAVPAPAPELVAPDIDFEIAVPPVITAPVAEPTPVPDPVPVIPAPSTGTDRIAPKLRAGQKPEYPSAARRAGEQGTTHLEVCVSTAGRVTSVSVAQSSGSPRLDDAAAKWIQGERFTPGSIGGLAQSMCGHDVFYQWNLQDAR